MLIACTIYTLGNMRVATHAPPPLNRIDSHARAVSQRACLA